MSGTTCDICQIGETVGVACSPLGPMSFAYCRECLETGAEPLWLVADTVASCGGVQNMTEGFQQIIDASLKRANKTQEDFDQMIKESIDYWTTHYQEQQEDGTFEY